MSDVVISEHTKLTGTGADFAALAASEKMSRVVVWDLGPTKPVAPVRPKAPKGVEGDPDYDLAMVEFRDAMDEYAAGLKEHKAALAAYADFEKRYGGPYEISMWSCDAADALARDPKRYCISSRTRGHERLKNGGLPPGMKPGHGQSEIERRASEGLADLEIARRSDPVFGTNEARS